MQQVSGCAHRVTAASSSGGLAELQQKCDLSINKLSFLLKGQHTAARAWHNNKKSEVEQIKKMSVCEVVCVWVCVCVGLFNGIERETF